MHRRTHGRMDGRSHKATRGHPHGQPDPPTRPVGTRTDRQPFRQTHGRTFGPWMDLRAGGTSALPPTPRWVPGHRQPPGIKLGGFVTPRVGAFLGGCGGGGKESTGGTYGAGRGRFPSTSPCISPCLGQNHCERPGFGGTTLLGDPRTDGLSQTHAGGRTHGQLRGRTLSGGGRSAAVWPWSRMEQRGDPNCGG